nr:MAG TPA: hypothetical protein [Caudoviricetes sp.]DAZ00458.1 MAG TPA: hypothetical protein [Caudoviricetes sp.]
MARVVVGHLPPLLDIGRQTSGTNKERNNKK